MPYSMPATRDGGRNVPVIELPATGGAHGREQVKHRLVRGRPVTERDRLLREGSFAPRSLVLLGIHAGCLIGLSTILRAQVTLDGTLGAKGPVIPNSADQFRITPDLGSGSRFGPNLFHSFSQFNLTPKQEAIFSGPASVRNILARVTGEASSIDGMLTSEIPGANLFLLNPKGITFGPHATLNIDGAFHASTAGYIALEDGRRFMASADDSLRLSAASPVAFGFLGPAPGSISITKAKLVNCRGNLSLVGGDIEIAGDNKSPATLAAPGSTVVLASVKSAGELALAPDQAAASASRFGQLGQIGVRAAVVDATPPEGVAGGQVFIRAGKLTVNGATIKRDSPQAGSGMGVDIETTGDIELRAGASVRAEARHASGKAAGIRMRGDSVVLESGASVVANNSATGVGPDLEIAAESSLRNGGVIRANNVEESQGNGGQLSLSAPSVEFGEGGRLYLENYGQGAPASLHLTADTLTLLPAAGIFAGTYGPAAGAALTFDVGDLAMRNESHIVADTVSTGPAGAITVNALRSVTLRQTDPPSGGDGIFISAATHSRGDAGTIAVTANTLTLEGAGAALRAITEGAGRGGMIQLRVDKLALLKGGKVVAYSEGAGDAGSILIAADTVRITEGGSVSSSSRGAGDGGAIQILGHSISVIGSGARVESLAQGQGAAGTVALASQGDLTIANGGQVLVSSALAAAGDIQLTAGGALRVVDGTIAASGRSGGEVSLSAVDQIYLLDATVSATSTSGQGGNIALPRLRPYQGSLDVTPGVTPRFVILNHSRLLANARGNGAGGNVGIEGFAYVKSADSQIDVSSTIGETGNESLPEESFNLASSLAQLRAVFVDQAAEWQLPARPEQIDPGGYTLVGRRRPGNTSVDNRRRIILRR